MASNERLDKLEQRVTQLERVIKYDSIDTPRKKPLKEITANDIPPGLTADDVATDYGLPLRPRKFY